MSFGFSVGDFLAVGRLVHDIITALRDSRAEYQELVRELESLARALDHVDHLRGPPNQTVAIDHIKCAALMCRQPLEDFQRKIKRFEKNLDVGNSRGLLKDAAKKAQWAFGLGKKDEVGRLRNYLNIHIGVINMQLIECGFQKVDIASEERAADHQVLKSSMEESLREVRDVRGDMQSQALMVKESKSIIQTLLGMVGGDVVAPLKALTGVVAKVCVSTQQIYNIVLEIRASTRGIDTRFTYFQSPVKIEDVLGRIFPFPAEFSIAALDAEIKDRFKVGPGKQQVAAGDYEIFNVRNTNELIGVTPDSILRPGMSLSMSIILERITKEDRCPVPRCQSTNSSETLGGKLCIDCDTWFKVSGKKRKRESIVSDLLDGPENGKKMKSSTQLLPDHEPKETNASESKEFSAEPDSVASQAGVFKRISLVEAPKFINMDSVMYASPAHLLWHLERKTSDDRGLCKYGFYCQFLDFNNKLEDQNLGPGSLPKHSRRAPRDDEYFIMKTFSRHCIGCFFCHNFVAEISDRRLCQKGVQQAKDVCQYVYSVAGQVFSIVDLESKRMDEVDIPSDCFLVKQLLVEQEFTNAFRCSLDPLWAERYFKVDLNEYGGMKLDGIGKYLRHVLAT